MLLQSLMVFLRSGKPRHQGTGIFVPRKQGVDKRQNHTEMGEPKATSKCCSILQKLQMDIVWVLFGTTTEVRLVSISEQNNSSTSQVKGPPCFMCTFLWIPKNPEAVGEPSFSLWKVI